MEGPELKGKDISFLLSFTSKPKPKSGIPKIDGRGTGMDDVATIRSGRGRLGGEIVTIPSSGTETRDEGWEGTHSERVVSSLAMRTHCQIGPLLSIPFYKRERWVR